MMELKIIYVGINSIYSVYRHGENVIKVVVELEKQRQKWGRVFFEKSYELVY